MDMLGLTCNGIYEQFTQVVVYVNMPVQFVYVHACLYSLLCLTRRVPAGCCSSN